MNSTNISSLKSILLRGGSCLILACGLALATNPILAAPADNRPDQRPNPRQQLEHLAETLGLTDTQRGQIQTILESQVAQMQALRDDETTPRDQKRERMRSLREAIQSNIRAVLTPEQQTKFDAMPRPEPRQGRPEGGKRPNKD